MSHQPDERILRYLEGRCEPEEAERIRCELSASPALARRAELARAGLDAVRALGDEHAVGPTPDVASGVMTRVAVTTPARRSKRSVWRWAAAIVLLLALPAAGWLMRGTVQAAGSAASQSGPPDGLGVLPGVVADAGVEPRGAAIMPEGSYLLLFLGLWPDDAELTPEQRLAREGEYVEWVRRLRAEGRLITGNHLSWQGGTEIKMTSNGISESRLRPPPDQVLTGFVLVYAESDEEARAIARSCPHVRYGTVLVKRAGE